MPVYKHDGRVNSETGYWYLLFPVDTGRKLNVHKTFKRRPEHLLNVLCSFNLRPVSTGLLDSLKKYFNKISIYVP